MANGLKDVIADLKETKKEMTKTLEQMNGLQKIMEETQDVEGKEQDFEDAQTTFEELNNKFQKMEGKVSKAEKAKSRYEMLKKVSDLSSIEVDDDTEGKSKNPNVPNTVPAEANDFNAKAVEHLKVFKKFIDKKAPLSDNEHELLRPKSEKFTDGGVALPPMIAKAIHGFDPVEEVEKKVFDGVHGKLMTSLQTSPSSLIPQDYRDQLLMLPAEPPYIYTRARKVPCPTGQVTWPRLVQTDSSEFGGVYVKWINEAEEKPETEPTFDQLQIASHELAARTEISHTLLRRSVIDLQAFLGIEFRMAMMNAVDIALLTGNGNGKPLGIMPDAIRSVPRQTANTIAYDDLVNMEHSLRSNHRANAIWVIADDAMGNLKKQKDNDGRPLFVPNPSTGAYDTLLGYPYITTHRLSLGEDDIVFGDWSQYIVPVEQEVVIKRSDDRKIEQNVAVFVVFMHIGGRAAQVRAFVKLGGVSES